MHNRKFLFSRKLTSAASIGAPHPRVSHARQPPRRRPTRGWHASCSNLAVYSCCGMKRGSLQLTNSSNGRHAGTPPLGPPPRSSCSASLAISYCSTLYACQLTFHYQASSSTPQNLPRSDHDCEQCQPNARPPTKPSNGQPPHPKVNMGSANG